MTWITVTSDKRIGLRPADARSEVDDDLFASGSLFIEADLGRQIQSDHTLFELHRHSDVSSHISISLTPAGEIIFTRTLGRRSLEVTLHANGQPLSGPNCISLSWDWSAKWGLLTLERTQDGTLFQKQFSDPLPWLKSDIDRINAQSREVTLSSALRGFGVSNAIEPVGLSPSLLRGTPIRTPTGYRPIEALQAGDCVMTDAGEKEILWSGGREVPAFTRFQPIHLLSPYLGLRQDITVAPDQPILIEGSEVEYLFGEEAVLVQAQALLHTPFARKARSGTTVFYHQLLLEDHQVIDAAGGKVSSLYAGHLAKSPEILANTMLGSLDTKKMPRHDNPAYPVLRDYEALTLRAALVSR